MTLDLSSPISMSGKILVFFELLSKTFLTDQIAGFLKVQYLKNELYDLALLKMSKVLPNDQQYIQNTKYGQV